MGVNSRITLVATKLRSVPISCRPNGVSLSSLLSPLHSLLAFGRSGLRPSLVQGLRPRNAPPLLATVCVLPQQCVCPTVSTPPHAISRPPPSPRHRHQNARLGRRVGQAVQVEKVRGGLGRPPSGNDRPPRSRTTMNRSPPDRRPGRGAAGSHPAGSRALERSRSASSLVAGQQEHPPHNRPC